MSMEPDHWSHHIFGLKTATRFDAQEHPLLLVCLACLTSRTEPSSKLWEIVWESLKKSSWSQCYSNLLFKLLNALFCLLSPLNLQISNMHSFWNQPTRRQYLALVDWRSYSSRYRSSNLQVQITCWIFDLEDGGLSGTDNTFEDIGQHLRRAPITRVCRNPDYSPSITLKFSTRLQNQWLLMLPLHQYQDLF